MSKLCTLLLLAAVATLAGCRHDDAASDRHERSMAKPAAPPTQVASIQR